MNNQPERSQSHEEDEIKAFCDSYRQLIQWIRVRLFAEKNVDHLLEIARFYGEIRWSNFDGVYQDNDVEDMVELRVLQSAKFILPELSKSAGSTVLIASSLYDSGGHSSVVLNWMKVFHGEDNHRLLITRTVAKNAEKTLKSLNVRYHLCSSQSTSQITEIVASSASAERIILHIHPDDIIAAVAARILARYGKEVIFYNHADHLFSYGLSSARLICEISSYGTELNKRARKIGAFCYLGIPIDLQVASIGAIPERAKGESTVLSCGASYKYMPSEFFFGDFIDNLLARRGCTRVLLVGPTGNEPWWCEGKNRWGSRVQFVGEVPHEKYMELLQQADVYVDSFPIPGGTAFPEALLSGKYVAGLSGPIQGYSPADELRVADVSLLAEKVEKLLDCDPICVAAVTSARNKTRTLHSMKGFGERLRAIYSGLRDEGAVPQVEIDTHSLERRWRKDRRLIAFYETSLWFELPWPYFITQMGFLFRKGNVRGLKFMLFVANRTAVRALPSFLRKEIVRRRTAYLKSGG